MNTATPDSKLKAWWHPRKLDAGQLWHCTIGPLSVFVCRQEQEWSLAWEQTEDLAESTHCESESAEQIPEHLVSSRYVFDQSPESFCLRPRLLDRPLVVKTRQPVRIPAKQKTTFYISSPVTVAVLLQKPEPKQKSGLVQGPELLLEVLPTLRLSDTWFGPSTQEGELCYAARTHARHSREELPLRAHRAVTPVTIENRSSEWLTIDKLSIPLPCLAVYGSPEDALWTDPISLLHTDDNQLANLIVGPVPEGLERLSPAQEMAQRNGLVRAFTSIFSD